MSEKEQGLRFWRLDLLAWSPVGCPPTLSPASTADLRDPDSSSGSSPETVRNRGVTSRRAAPDAANWFAPSSFPRRTWTAEDSHIPGWHLEGVVTSSVQAVACGVTRGPIVCAQRLKMARIKCKSAPALIRSASPARYHTMSDRLTHPLLEDTRRTDGVIKSQDYDGRERVVNGHQSGGEIVHYVKKI